MFLILVAATSLLIQAYVFRNTEAHPFDRCATEASVCPEESLDSLRAAHEDRLAGLRAAAFRSPAGIDTSRIGSRGPGD